MAFAQSRTCPVTPEAVQATSAWRSLNATAACGGIAAPPPDTPALSGGRQDGVLQQQCASCLCALYEPFAEAGLDPTSLDFFPANPLDSMTSACILANLNGFEAKGWGIGSMLANMMPCSPTTLPQGPFPATGHEPPLCAWNTWNRFHAAAPEPANASAAEIQSAIGGAGGGLLGGAPGDGVPVPRAFGAAYSDDLAALAIALGCALALALTLLRALGSCLAIATIRRNRTASAASLRMLHIAKLDVQARNRLRPIAHAIPNVFALRHTDPVAAAEEIDAEAAPPPTHSPPPRGGRTVVLVTAENAQLRAGRCCAIIGQSGAGKSTLLRAMARAPLPRSVTITGCVLADGAVVLGDEEERATQPPSSQQWSSRAFVHAMSFMDQGSDVLVAHLTVWENVAIHANLTLPLLTDAERASAVRQTLESVRCESSLWDRTVGTGAGDDGGLSGGERRRIGLACAIVRKPLVLIADEPTSGLDSASAIEITDMLSAYARDRHVIVAVTIHQPSAHVFKKFDDVWIVVQGKLAFSGTMGDAEALCRTAMNGQRDDGAAGMHEAMPTADSLVELSLAEIEAALEVMVNSAPLSSAAALPPGLEEDASEEGTSNPHAKATDDGDVSRALDRAEMYRPYHIAVSTLLRREVKSVIRRTGAHILAGVLLGLLLGLLYKGVPNTLPGVINRLGGIFFMLCLFGFNSLTGIDIAFANRDRDQLALGQGELTAAPLVAARACADAALLRALPSVLYAIIFYPLAGFAGFNRASPGGGGGLEHFAIFVAIAALYAVCMGLQSSFVATLCPSSGTATLIASIVVLFEVLLGGFLLNPASMPAPVLGLKVLSPFNHAFAALALNELKGTSVRFTVSVQLQGAWSTVTDLEGSTFLTGLGIDDAASVLQHASVLVVLTLGLAWLWHIATASLLVPWSRWRRGRGRRTLNRLCCA